MKSGSKKKNAVKYNNVIKKPLITNDDGSCKILSKVNFPEIHIMTGIVGKLVKQIELKAFPTTQEGTEFMNNWMESVNVSRTVYHGSASFVGDMAKLLLLKTDSLAQRAKDTLDTEIYHKVVPFVKTLEQFNLVRETCFGQELLPGCKDAVKEFSKQYRSLGISIPPKVHIVESHLIEFLEDKGEEHGAGYWSEQAMELCHKDFQNELEPNKVPQKHSDYGRKLLNIIIRYNGKHI